MAHMTILLENLNEEQTQNSQYYRKKKGVNGDYATKKDVFLTRQIPINKFKGADTINTASISKEQFNGNKSRNKCKGSNCKEEHPHGCQHTLQTTATRTQKLRFQKDVMKWMKNVR